MSSDRYYPHPLPRRNTYGTSSQMVPELFEDNSRLLYPPRELTGNLPHQLLQLDKGSSTLSADLALDWDRCIYHLQPICRIVPLSSSKHIDINQKIDNRIFLESYDYERKGLIYTYRK